MSNQNGHKNHVLLVDDVPANLQVLRKALEPNGYEVSVATNGSAALKIAKTTIPDAILLDVMMPGMTGFDACEQLQQDDQTADIPVIFLTASNEQGDLIQGFDAGGVDYITKPFDETEVLVRLKTHLEIGRLNRLLKEKNEVLEAKATELESANHELKVAIARQQEAEAERDLSKDLLHEVSEREDARWGIQGICGESDTLKHILKQVEQLQATDTTSVLIVGESGTGKELVARAIHYGGVRSQKAFVPVNCSAVPAELTEASFFGHERGAFTGADRSRKGYFEQADGGTLFLDEIGDMPAELQAKLLRVLEDGEVTPVGSNTPRKVDVRILSATHADVHQRIETGHFRQDLYYRLAGVTVAVPPLRDREGDLVVLARHFLSVFAAEMVVPTPRLSAEALAVMKDYDFPGNIRELKNMMESALIQSGGNTILPLHLHRSEHTTPPPISNVSGPVVMDSQQQEEMILAFVKEQGSINNVECRNLLQIERRRATYILDKLCEGRQLEQTGSRRWTRYELVEKCS